MVTNTLTAPAPSPRSFSAPEPSRSPHSAVVAGRDLFHRWIAALEKRDPHAAASLYAEEGAALWGTFGDRCRTSRGEILSYFQFILAADEVRCTVDSARWRMLGPSASSVSGSCTFHISHHTGPARLTRARFTFVFEEQAGGDWKIVEHHSSRFPTVGY